MKTYDLLVVGAGIVGLAHAYEASKRGLTVGGEPAPFSLWEQNTFYKKLTQLKYKKINFIILKISFFK